MASSNMNTAYKVSLLGLVFLVVLLLATSVLKCPVPAITKYFRMPQLLDISEYNWDCELTFNRDENTLLIHRTNAMLRTNQTVLQMVINKDKDSKNKWRGMMNPREMMMSRDQSTLVVKRRTPKNPLCYNVTSSTRGPNGGSVSHCVKFGSDSWYGGAEMFEQKWPMNAVHSEYSELQESQSIKFFPFISHDFGNNHEAPGSVLERYWLSSSGVGIFVDREVPLFVGYNQTNLCLKSASLEQGKTEEVQLKYTVCVGNNVKAIHQFMAKSHWPNPTGVPDDLMIKNPIWTTWALYKKQINQSTVTSFAQEITKHNFPISHIEIDDKYSTHYGDFDFDKKKFPNPKKMIQTLHDMGCRVTAWIHPFMNRDSVNFGLAKKSGYLVFKDKTETEPVITKWWDGYGGLLDFTNKAAAKWYFERRKGLDELGMDSYKFDAGESNFLTQNFSTYATINDPNEYSTFYATSAASFTNRAIEVRVGYMTQHLPVFVRVMDMNSVWSGGRGLDVLIPTVLHFGLIGYPFVLPDMIGGNGYKGQYPDKELFIRWTQVTAFLPSMQFSYVPWAYDQQVIDISRDMVTLHIDYVTPLIYKWSKIAVETGEPIIRPLWWLAPTDKKTYNESTSFLIGNDVLIAPIISKGSTKRDIYLPKGTWKDMLRNKIVRGPITLSDYSIPLTDIAYFEYVKRKVYSAKNKF